MLTSFRSTNEKKNTQTARALSAYVPFFFFSSKHLVRQQTTFFFETRACFFFFFCLVDTFFSYIAFSLIRKLLNEVADHKIINEVTKKKIKEEIKQVSQWKQCVSFHNKTTVENLWKT